MADSSVDLIGRAAERAELGAFVDALASGPAGLSLDGSAGVGKTTLWLSGLALGRERGCRTLITRPAAADAGLAFAGLGDLLGGVLDEVLDDLPSPQADALRVALLLQRPRAPLDERAVGVAVLSALRALSAERPLILAVDDVHWLDAASAAVLSFSYRRLSDEPVGLLLTRRSSEALPRALEGLERLRRVVVGSLGLEDLHRLLADRLGVVFPLPALRRVHAVSGGNPFFALEIGRAFDRQRAMLAAGHVPPLPEELVELVIGRIAALPGATQEALAAIATLSQPTLTLVSKLAAGDEALRPALHAHVVELDGDRPRFSHPLLAAAASETLDPVAQRALHRRLAELVSDEDERARLLALGVHGADADVAAALERAAARAQARGASTAAAELCEQARLLTPADASAGQPASGRRRSSSRSAAATSWRSTRTCAASRTSRRFAARRRLTLCSSGPIASGRRRGAGGYGAGRASTRRACASGRIGRTRRPVSSGSFIRRRPIVATMAPSPRSSHLWRSPSSPPVGGWTRRQRRPRATRRPRRPATFRIRRSRWRRGRWSAPRRAVRSMRGWTPRARSPSAAIAPSPSPGSTRSGRSRCSISSTTGRTTRRTGSARCGADSSPPVSASRGPSRSSPTRSKRSRQPAESQRRRTRFSGSRSAAGRSIARRPWPATAGALAAFERALEQYARVPLPFERARTLLLLGSVQRRTKRRGAARATLEAAEALFTDLGTEFWARRARAESARIGGRRARDDDELTPTEARIAEAAAEGRSNREIAATLFLSERTVEANLTRVYRKLGVRSRAQLGRRLPNG